jgi:hypothetical protein
MSLSFFVCSDGQFMRPDSLTREWHHSTRLSGELTCLSKQACIKVARASFPSSLLPFLSLSHAISLSLSLSLSLSPRVFL